MNGSQCRLARIILGFGVRELAELAGVSTQTIVRFEKGEPLKSATIERIKRPFDEAGIEFIPEDEHGGIGIRLKKSE